jgi:hypothetical protein
MGVSHCHILVSFNWSLKLFETGFDFFFSKCRLTKSLCTEPKPVSVFKNNQLKEKAKANELDEHQS